jgi:hypothetical protein
MLGSCFLHANKSLLTVRVIVSKMRKDANKVGKSYNDSTIDATPLLQQEKKNNT